MLVGLKWITNRRYHPNCIFISLHFYNHKLFFQYMETNNTKKNDTQNGGMVGGLSASLLQMRCFQEFHEFKYTYLFNRVKRSIFSYNILLLVCTEKLQACPKISCPVLPEVGIGIMHWPVQFSNISCFFCFSMQSETKMLCLKLKKQEN